MKMLCNVLVNGISLPKGSECPKHLEEKAIAEGWVEKPAPQAELVAPPVSEEKEPVKAKKAR